MNRLLKIEFSKLLSYRTFWILIGIYFVVMGITTMSGMEFLKWLAEKGAQFGEVAMSYGTVCSHIGPHPTLPATIRA